MKFNINDIERVTKGRLLQKGSSEEVLNVVIDSRELEKGECFLALRGPHFDGTDFIDQAVSRGASAVIANCEIDLPEKISLIVVDDPVEALGAVASLWRENFNVPCVGITGSNGKSTTKQMVTGAIGSLGPILRTEGNYNNLIGLPLTVLRWNEDHAAAVLEMGMNAPGEIAALTKIARPHVGVITNVSSAHLEFLHNIDNVAKAKGELFENMRSDGTIIVNLEDPRVVKLASGYAGQKYTFGMQNGADVQFGRLESRDLESIDMTIYVEGKEYPVHLPVPGTHNVMNVMAAVSVARVLGVDAETAIKGVESFEPMSMRMERVVLANGIQLVNDCYNANPHSVKEALRTVSGAKKAGRFIAVLGDMLELGETAHDCHKEVGLAAAEHNADMLYIFGDHAKSVEEGALEGGLHGSKVIVEPDMDELKEKVLAYVNTGDIILIKGSRGMQMERVVDYLKDEIGVE